MLRLGLTRRRILLVTALALPVITIAIFYGAMNALARHEAHRAGITRMSRNSIQHAYAAEETYAGLRLLGLGSETATDLVIQLGYLNEWFENRIQSRDKNTAEIYKDLNNNMSGLVAAQWLQECGWHRPRARLRLIGKLAKEQAIYYSSTDSRIPPLPMKPDVTAAIERFEPDRDAIVDRVSAVLGAYSLPCEKNS